MARVDIGASRLRKRRRMRMVRFSLICVAALLVFIGLIAWSTWAPFWRIKTIDVSGTQTLATSTIEQFVAGQLQGARGFIFAKNNILLYPKQQVTDSLLTSMPTIDSAAISAASFSALSVKVSERQPKALWCGTQAPLASSTVSEQCYLLDSYGAAYAPADITGAAYERYYGTLTGTALPKQFLTPGTFQALSALVDALSAQEPQDAIVSVEVDLNSDVHIGFASGFELLFSLSDAGGDVFERFTLALSSDPFKGKQLSDFQYLDLRFGDKLYYKTK